MSPNYFALLGANSQLGRVFGEQDRVPGFADAVILSDGIWRRLFGGDPAILGRKLRLDTDLYTVVGVMDDAANLGRALKATRPDRIVVALAERRGRLPLDPLLESRARGILVEDVVETYERLTGKLALEAL